MAVYIIVSMMHGYRNIEKLLLFLSDVNQRCTEFICLKKLPDVSGSPLETCGKILGT